MAINNTSKRWLAGYLIGNFSKQKPATYSYNGIRFPDIYKVYTPELQKTYLYAYIYGFTATPSLVLIDYPLRYDNSDESSPFHNFENIACNWISYSLDETRKNWIFSNSGYSEKGMGITGLLWTNYNIYNTDGTLKLAASDPIPVFR